METLFEQPHHCYAVNLAVVGDSYDAMMSRNRTGRRSIIGCGTLSDWNVCGHGVTREAKEIYSLCRVLVVRLAYDVHSPRRFVMAMSCASEYSSFL
jgi:hypothetical protein